MKLIEPSYIRELADIRLNEEHWIQKINLIEFNDKNIPGTPQKGKTCWTRNYEKIPHWQRFNTITKWYKNTDFLEYSCKIVKNEVGEIELYTRNAFGEPATIYWKGQDIIRKIRKKLGEEVRRKDKDLLSELKEYDSDEEVEFEPGPVLETPKAESSTNGGKGKGAEKPHKYKEQPERVEKPEISAEDEKLLRDYRKELKDLGKNASMSDEGLNDLVNSKHTHLYYDEVEALRELRTRKNNLGTDQIQKTYDLGRPDLAILWRKQLYFIIDYQYVNNYKMYTWIRARKCKLALYYWNWQRQGGRGVLEYAPNNLIEEVKEYDDDGQPKNLMQSSRMHYEFCGELGVKRIYQSEFQTYQPKFSLFYADHAGKRTPSWAEKKERSETVEGKPILIPSDLHLKQLPDMKEKIQEALGGDTADMIGGLFEIPFTMANLVLKEIINIIPNLAGKIGKGVLKIATLGAADIPDAKLKIFDNSETYAKLRKILNDILGGKVFLTIGPREHDQGGSFFSKMEHHEEILFKTTPQSKPYIGKNEAQAGKKYKERFKEQPHLWDHTTIQFYLFNNITMMGNGQFLGIQYRKDIDNFVLPYNLYINHAPSVLVYRWEFKYITVKCEIKCVGTFQDNFNLARVITSISVLGCGIGLNASGVNVNSLKDQDQMKPATNPEAEQQGERTFKSTLFDSLNKSIEPAMMAGNTIDFHYSLAEFFCRLTDPIWFYRVELSELLYNNLKWCNNKSKILYLPLEWGDLMAWTQGKLYPEDHPTPRLAGKDKRRLGFWRWKGVKLDNDYDGFFTDIMTRGYLLDGGEDKKNPRLIYERQEGYVKQGGNEWDTYEAEEEYIEKEVITKERGDTAEIDGIDTATAGRLQICSIFGVSWLGGGHSGLVGNEDKRNYFKELCEADLTALCENKSSYISNTWWYFPPGLTWSKTYSIPPGVYGITWHTNAGLDNRKDVPADSFTITIDGSKGTLTTHGETETKKIIRESIFKEKKTTTQEIDEEKLEDEYDIEDEACGEEELPENEVETEEGEQGEGVISEKDREREREREKEEEGEKEGEGEKEQEGEKEDETEKETEKEKEKEKEREKEKEKEREKESEDESESESEDEDEGEGENEA